MAELIEHIDAIARAERRDVLYIEFHRKDWYDWGSDSLHVYQYKNDARREQVLTWLDEHGISWRKCGPFFRDKGLVRQPYLGEICLDIPFDESDAGYCLVRDYLENPDGSMRDENVRLYVITLEKALGNVHKAEPEPKVIVI
jgi:hypothetical protein